MSQAQSCGAPCNDSPGAILQQPPAAPAPDAGNAGQRVSHPKARDGPALWSEQPSTGGIIADSPETGSPEDLTAAATVSKQHHAGARAALDQCGERNTSRGHMPGLQQKHEHDGDRKRQIRRAAKLARLHRCRPLGLDPRTTDDASTHRDADNKEGTSDQHGDPCLDLFIASTRIAFAEVAVGE